MDIKIAQALGPIKLSLMDTAVVASSRRLKIYGNDVPCKPGCAGCCSRLIRITMAEATILYEHLVQNGEWTEVRKEARDQFSLVKEVDPVAWFKMNRSCPVLNPKTRNCRGYAVRPAFCSTHFVTSSPDLCDPWNAADGIYQPVDMDDLMEIFSKRVSENVAGYGIFGLELALPVALLLAERISVQSGLELDQAVKLLFREFA